MGVGRMISRRDLLVAGAGVGVGLLGSRLIDRQSDRDSDFRDPTLVWETAEGTHRCKVKLDPLKSMLGDADAIIIKSDWEEYRYSGDMPNSLEVSPPRNLEYGGQISAFAESDGWRKPLFIGRVNSDCELVEAPYSESHGWGLADD